MRDFATYLEGLKKRPYEVWNPLSFGLNPSVLLRLLPTRLFLEF